jgi:hypothetical protein
MRVCSAIRSEANRNVVEMAFQVSIPLQKATWPFLLSSETKKATTGTGRLAIKRREEGLSMLSSLKEGNRSNCTGQCANAFYDPELNAHFFHVAGDSDDNGTIWVFRLK